MSPLRDVDVRNVMTSQCRTGTPSCQLSVNVWAGLRCVQVCEDIDQRQAVVSSEPAGLFNAEPIKKVDKTFMSIIQVGF